MCARHENGAELFRADAGSDPKESKSIMTHQVCADKKNEILSLYRAGGSLVGIAHKLHTTKSYIRDTLVELGEPIRSRKEQAAMSKSEAALSAAKVLLVEMCDSGAMMKDAARQASVSLDMARKLLRAANRSDLIREPKSDGKSTTEAEHKTALGLWNEGLNKCEISRRMGRAPHTVTNMLRRMDVQNLYDPRTTARNGSGQIDSEGSGQIAADARDAEARDRAAIVVRTGRSEFGLTVDEARGILSRLGPPIPSIRQGGTASAMCAELGTGKSRCGVGGTGRSSIEQRRRRESVLALAGVAA
jgi:hypothetical protein